MRWVGCLVLPTSLTTFATPSFGYVYLSWLGVPVICTILYLGGPAGTMHVCTNSQISLHHDQNMRDWTLLLQEPFFFHHSYESWSNGNSTVNGLKHASTNLRFCTTERIRIAANDAFSCIDTNKWAHRATGETWAKKIPPAISHVWFFGHFFGHKMSMVCLRTVHTFSCIFRKPTWTFFFWLHVDKMEFGICTCLCVINLVAAITMVLAKPRHRH